MQTPSEVTRDSGSEKRPSPCKPVPFKKKLQSLWVSLLEVRNLLKFLEEEPPERW